MIFNLDYMYMHTSFFFLYRINRCQKANIYALDDFTHKKLILISVIGKSPSIRQVYTPELVMDHMVFS